MLTEIGAVVLALTLTGLWSYLMARAGVWAAVRHAAARHDAGAHGAAAGSVCLRCLRESLNAHREERGSDD